MMTRLLSAILLAGCAHETALQLLTHYDNAMITCDVGQTIYASDGGKWDRPGNAPGTVQRELNPLLGATPSIAKITTVGVLDVGLNTAIGYSRLPPWVRWAWLGAVGLVETTMVIEHYRTAGLCGV
jgi:hypothetical protein